MTINIRDDTIANLAIGASVDFDQAVIAGSVKGSTATIGTRILFSVRVTASCDLTVAYATNGPHGTLVFRDRGTIDKLVSFAMFRGSIMAVGTNVRITITNTSSGTAGVEFFSTLL